MSDYAFLNVVIKLEKNSVKGDSNPMISMFYQKKKLYELCILIQVSSKSVKVIAI